MIQLEFHTMWVLQQKELKFFEILFETPCILRGNFGQSIGCGLFESLEKSLEKIPICCITDYGC